MKRIGIMGGTFNPIHYGHLTLAEFSCKQFGLDEIMFLPSKKPAYKPNKDLVSDSHRLTMIKLAIKGNPYFYTSDMEYEREGNTYTADTMDILSSRNPDAEYFFIMGADSLFTFENWKDPERIIKHCSLIAAIRGAHDLQAVQIKSEELSRLYNGRILIAEIPGIDISSNMIRQRIREGLTVRYLVPDPVISYININNLYRAD